MQEKVDEKRDEKELRRAYLKRKKDTEPRLYAVKRHLEVNDRAEASQVDRKNYS